MQGQIVTDVRRARTWLRVVSALLALAFAWALVVSLANGEVGTWFSSGIMLGALYGGYLCAHFAVYGRVAGAPPGCSGERPGNWRH